MAKDLEAELRKIATFIIDKLTLEECQRLQYIYNIPECHRATKLNMFEYLQNYKEMFSSENPEGLINIASDIERQDLVKSVTAKVQEYKKKSKMQAEPLRRTHRLNQNPELKRYFEATIKLYPLHDMYVKYLKSVVADVAQDDPEKPNTSGISQLISEADECFKKGTDKMLKAAQAVGFKPSKDNMSQLIPYQPQEVSTHEESKGKGRFKKLFQRQKQKPKVQKSSVPYRARSFDSLLNAKDDPYERLDTSDDEQAVHNTGARTPMNVPTREHHQAPQQRVTTSEEDSDSKKSDEDDVTPKPQRSEVVIATPQYATITRRAVSNKLTTPATALQTQHPEEEEEEEEEDESRITGGSTDSGVAMGVDKKPTSHGTGTADIQHDDDDDAYEIVNTT